MDTNSCNISFSFAAADAVRNDQIAELLSKRQERDVRELNKAMNEFRLMHQQPASRREFDIYDPDHLRKDKPARVSDDDPRCGISGLQKFDGEDLNNKARSKYQQEQLREWSAKQKRERDQAEFNQKEADRLYDLKMRELDERAMELQRAEEDCRTAIKVAESDYNMALVSNSRPFLFAFLLLQIKTGFKVLAPRMPHNRPKTIKLGTFALDKTKT